MSNQRNHTSKQFFSGKCSVPDTSSPLPHKKKTCTTGGFRRKIGHPLRCAPPWPPWVMYPWRPNETSAAPRHFGHDAVVAGLGESSQAPWGNYGWLRGGISSLVEGAKWFVVEWELSFIEGGWIKLNEGWGGILFSLMVFLQLPVLAIWWNYQMN